MVENFTQAALRHWRDAECLTEKGGIENADQLYGLAAECAIKHALLRLPAFSSQGVLQETYKQHIDVLWRRVGHQSLQKSHPRLLAMIKAEEPFQDWEIKQRYCADGGISHEKMKPHQEAAKKLLTFTGLHGSRHK